MSAVVLTRQQVEQALAQWGLTPYRMLDEVYWSASKDYWDLILASSPVYGPWVAEFNDCDDISEQFRVDVHRIYWVKPGIVENATHSFNIAIFPDLALKLIDAGWSVGPVYVEPGFPDTLYDLAGGQVRV